MMRFGSSDERQDAFKKLKLIFTKYGEQRNVKMSTPGGQFYTEVFLIQKPNSLWARLANNGQNTAWLCQFGIEMPEQENPLVTMNVQINLPVNNGYRRGAIIIDDDNKKTYLAHRGGLGGGHNVVTIADFFREIQNENNFQVVELKINYKFVKYIIVGDIHEESFLCSLRSYVAFCKRIRENYNNDDTNDNEIEIL